MVKTGYGVYDQMKQSGFVRGPGKHKLGAAKAFHAPKKAETPKEEKSEPKKSAKAHKKEEKGEKHAPKTPRKSFTGDESSEAHAPMPEMGNSDPLINEPDAVMPLHGVSEMGPDGEDEPASPHRPKLLVHLGGDQLYHLKRML